MKRSKSERGFGLQFQVFKKLVVSALKEIVLLSLKKELDNVILFKKKCIFATSKMAG